MNGQYNYAVFKGKHNFPLHIVNVSCQYLSAFAVFNSARDAMNYIQWVKENRDSNITYNSEMPFCNNLLKLYLSADRLFTYINRKQLYIAY